MAIDWSKYEFTEPKRTQKPTNAGDVTKSKDKKVTKSKDSKPKPIGSSTRSKAFINMTKEKEDVPKKREVGITDIGKMDWNEDGKTKGTTLTMRGGKRTTVLKSKGYDEKTEYRNPANNEIVLSPLERDDYTLKGADYMSKVEKNAFNQTWKKDPRKALSEWMTLTPELERRKGKEAGFWERNILSGTTKYLSSGTMATISLLDEAMGGTRSQEVEAIIQGARGYTQGASEKNEEGGTAINLLGGVVQGTAQLGTQVIASLISAPLGVASLVVPAIGSYSEEGRDSGANLTERLIYGSVGGGAEAVLQKVLFINRLTKMAFGKDVAVSVAQEGLVNMSKHAGKKALVGKALEGAVGEGLEEALIDPLTGLLAKGTFDKDRQWFGEGGVVDPAQMAYDGLVGAIVGGGVATGVTAPQMQQLKQAKAYIDLTYPQALVSAYALPDTTMANADYDSNTEVKIDEKTGQQKLPNDFWNTAEKVKATIMGTDVKNTKDATIPKYQSRETAMQWRDGKKQVSLNDVVDFVKQVEADYVEYGKVMSQKYDPAIPEHAVAIQKLKNIDKTIGGVIDKIRETTTKEEGIKELTEYANLLGNIMKIEKLPKKYKQSLENSISAIETVKSQFTADSPVSDEATTSGTPSSTDTMDADVRTEVEGRVLEEEFEGDETFEGIDVKNYKRAKTTNQLDFIKQELEKGTPDKEIANAIVKRTKKLPKGQVLDIYKAQSMVNSVSRVGKKIDKVAKVEGSLKGKTKQATVIKKHSDEIVENLNKVKSIGSINKQAEKEMMKLPKVNVELYDIMKNKIGSKAKNKHNSTYEKFSDIIKLVENVPWFRGMTFEFHESEKIEFLTKEEVEKRGYIIQDSDKSVGGKYQFQIKGYHANGVNDSSRRITVFAGADTSTLLEELIHEVQNKLHKINPEFSKALEIWETNYIKALRSNGYKIAKKNEKHLATEGFADAVVLSEMGWANEDMDTANAYGIESEAVATIRDIIGKDLFKALLGETAPTKAKEQRQKISFVEAVKKGIKNKEINVEQKVLKNGTTKDFKQFSMVSVAHDTEKNRAVKKSTFLFEVHAPDGVTSLEDGMPYKDFKTFQEARDSLYNPERFDAYQEYYKKLMADPESIYTDWKKLVTIPTTKTENTVEVSLTEGCQRTSHIVEGILWGHYPPNTPTASCYGGTCFTDWTLHTNIQNDRHTVMNVKDMKIATPDFLRKSFEKPAFIKRLNDAMFIRHGVRGDESHSISSGLALEWLKLCREFGITKKNVFITSSYAPVSAEQYAELSQYSDIMTIHFTDSAWFPRNEMMQRMAEFETARDNGLNPILRLVTNTDNVTGIDMQTRYNFLKKMMYDLQVPQNRILETPFHDDRGANDRPVEYKKQKFKLRSKPSNDYMNICCETGKCNTCAFKCLNNPNPKQSIVDYYDKPDTALYELEDNMVGDGIYDLDIKQYSMKLSPQQENFFKDSKVRDENGDLLEVYHGTAEEFFTFDRTRQGENYFQGEGGFFFTDRNNTAKNYAKLSAMSYRLDTDGEVVSAYLNLTNPLIVTAPSDVRSLEYYDDHTAELRHDAMSRDRDGIIVKGNGENLYIAFEPEQIKSVANTTPTSNPDIRYSMKPTPSPFRNHKVLLQEVGIITEKTVMDAGNSTALNGSTLFVGGVKHKDLILKYFNGIEEDGENIRAYDPKITGVPQNLEVEYQEQSDRMYRENKDSNGRKLTPEQTEFFKDSKVRDAEGKLLSVYHGTPDGDFNTFELPKFLSSLMSQQGAGFYFTDKANANQYKKGVNKSARGNKRLFETYLNIKNPLEITSSSKVLTQEQVMNIVNVGNYTWFFENGLYHQAGLEKGTDKSTAVNKWVDQIMRYGDASILSEITRAFTGDSNAILDAMIEHTGYDGVRYTDSHGDIWVAWGQNQIKDVINELPTVNPDIRYSMAQIDTPAFRQWFGESKVLNPDGTPKVMYSGHSNVEMYGTKFNPRKATSGGFFTTDDTDIASNYAIGKVGAKENYENGAQYRIASPKGVYNKKLWQITLNEEQIAKADEFIKEIGYNFKDYIRDNRKYDSNANRWGLRGGLRDLQSIYEFLDYMGDTTTYMGEFFQTKDINKLQNSNFENMLTHIGLKWNSFERPQPAVMPIYLRIENPIDTSKPFPEDLLADLDKSSKRERVADNIDTIMNTRWTTDYPLKLWVKDIKEAQETGEDTYWATQIPKKALPILKRHGYDGIKDVGGHTTGNDHEVWIALEPNQVKSAVGNTGAYSVENDDIRYKMTLLHGSPKKFVKFDIRYGNNFVYGHGTYFTDSPTVASQYSDGGYVYSVDVDANEDSFLDSDLTLDQQNDYVKSRLEEAFKVRHDGATMYYLLDEKGRHHSQSTSLELLQSQLEDGWKIITEFEAYKNMKGNLVYHHIGSSKVLNSLGIEGTKFSMLTRTEDGITKVRGYCVFDSSKVEIDSVESQEEFGKKFDTDVMYSMQIHHGSPKRFTKFNPKKVSVAMNGYGTYFTDDIVIAMEYALSQNTKSGYIYDAYVDADEDSFLDFDKLWNEQNEYIRVQLGDVLVELEETGIITSDDAREFSEGLSYSNGREIYEAISQMHADLDGIDARPWDNEYNSKTSAILLKHGIDGNKYKDVSTQIGRNYVVYDAKKVVVDYVHSSKDYDNLRDYDEYVERDIKPWSDIILQNNARGNAVTYSMKKVETDSTAFLEWFGNSTVKDNNGNPRVVYHGAPSRIEEFSKSYWNTGQGSRGMGHGFYFTASTGEASEYGDNIIPVYLKIENMLDLGNLEEYDSFAGAIESLTDDYLPKIALGQWGKPEVAPTHRAYMLGKALSGTGDERGLRSAYGLIDWARVLSEEATKYTGQTVTTDMLWKEIGFDGMKDGSHYIAFDPEQIKSAVENNGDFSRSNPNIHYQMVKKPLLPVNTDSENFRYWFSDSKIITEDGNPRIMYRANRTFEDVDNAVMWHRPNDMIYMSSERHFADNWSSHKHDDDARSVYPVYVYASNPYDFRDDARREEFVAVFKRNFDEHYASDPDREGVGNLWWMYEGYLQRGDWFAQETQLGIKALAELGYDGMWLTESDWHYENGEFTLAVWDSSQIKSAEHNTGDFATDVQNIFYDMKPLNDVRQMSFGRTFMDGDVTEKVRKKMQKSMDKGNFDYLVQHNDKLMLDARTHFDKVTQGGKYIEEIENWIMGEEQGSDMMFACAMLLQDHYMNKKFLGWQYRTGKAVALTERVAEKSKTMGQAIQALSMWGRLSPEGIIRYATKLLNESMTPKEQQHIMGLAYSMKAQFEKLTTDAVDNLDIDQLIDEVKEQNDPAEAQMKAIATVLANSVEGDSVSMMTETLTKFAKDRFPSKSFPDPIDYVIDAIKNRKQYKEVWAKTQNEVWRQLASEQRSDLVVSKFFNYTPTSFVDESMLQKAIGKQLRDLKTTVRQIVLDSYKNQGQSVDSIVRGLVENAGLNRTEAEMLEKKIRKQLGVMTDKEKRKIANRMFKDKDDSKKANDSGAIDRIIEMSNIGVLSKEEYALGIANKLGMHSADPEFFQILHEKAQILQTLDGQEKIEMSAMIMDDIAGKLPMSIWRKVASFQTIAQLLNPVTALRNIYGNGGFAIAEYISDNFAVPLDMMMYYTGKTSFGKRLGFTGERTTLYRPIQKILAEGRGFKKGFMDAHNDIQKDINTFQSKSKFDIPTDRIWRTGAMKYVERALSYELRAFDRASYMSAFVDSIEEQLIISGLDMPTTEMMEYAHALGLYRTFQDDTVLSAFFSGMKRTLNIVGFGKKTSNSSLTGTKEFGLGDLVLKYPKTPANLLARGIDYSPAGVMVTAIKLFADHSDSSYMKQKMFVSGMSRAMVGTSIFAIGARLFAEGILTGSGDDEEHKDITLLKKIKGLGNYQMNWTALKRWLLSGGVFGGDSGGYQDGDKLGTYDWFLPMGLGLSIGADIEANKGLGGIGVTILASLEESTTAFAEQPMLTGLTTLFGGNPYDDAPNIISGAGETLMGAPASFIPTFMSRSMQMFDNRAMNSYNNNNNIQTMFNKVLVKTALRNGLETPLGDIDAVEPYITPFGDESVYWDKESKNLGERFFDAYLNPSYSAEYKNVALVDWVLKLNSYAPDRSSEFAPSSKANWKYDIGDEKVILTQEEYRMVSEFKGSRMKEEYQAVMDYYGEDIDDTDTADAIISDLAGVKSKIGKEVRKEVARIRGIDTE